MSKLLAKLPYPAILALAAFFGALMPLAFAPLSIWPLLFLLLALLFLLVETQTSCRRAFYIGWFFGMGYFGFGVYWVYNSLYNFGGAPPVVAGFLTALLILFLALYIGLVLCGWKFIQRTTGRRDIWILPLLWFAFEWLRGWFLTGMPWLSLGYSQTESPLAGFAPLIGVYGLSALSVFIGLALLRVVLDREYRHIALIVLIPGAGIALQNIDWTEAQTSSLKVTMVQGNIPQDVKWQYDQRQNIFNTYWRETTKNWDSDLIVWPETALPGRSEVLQQDVLEPMAKAAAEQDSSILTGIVVTDSANDLYYNSMLLLGKDQGVYHKRHLVVFGEYFPMRWLLDFLRGMINIPFSDMEAGPLEQPLLSVNGVKIGLSICFEVVFTHEIMLAMPAANLLVNASNDAWFGDSLAPHQHLQIAQMRALETGRPMIRSTNTGISAFIDYRGRLIEKSDEFKTQSMTRIMVGRTGVTPFYYVAKIQGLIALLILAVLLFYVVREHWRNRATSL
ncbi:MAG: apolipoprotein N-acyltransferase [Gammaproteobacteria bacterium]